ncbi:cupin domain-containing protein [Oleiagrimonas soli]|uniref:Mannose-6-phosphate isomerase-like protein (Cupin superfamily) n=1 Tax=Oleiagrimonas soli TaxID=1543381 RepID=A0A841KE93_9GAMM|nr:cupin domain-containing protein [Oleiagrimonas soli]MBB6183943.1 mannose-6-phosphate isomerase-like protein (cupin superfamily) [Oleiagrimonas soli]
MSKRAPGVIDARTAPHYRWGEVCDGWHLLAGDDLSVIEERVPPGASETRHRHTRARQFFYVLEGEATMELEGVEHVLRAGQGLHVPPGATHCLRNASEAAVRFLVVSAPKSHGDRETVAEADAFVFPASPP